MDLINAFKEDLRRIYGSKAQESCDHPDHEGCRFCDEDALPLNERERYEGYDDGPD